MKTVTIYVSPLQSDSKVTAKLQKVLAGTYGLYLATHNYHWNVEGANFSSLHLLFSGQYNELFQADDVIAERIRAIGDYALPFEGENVLQLSKLTSNPLNKEKEANARAVRMIRNLIDLNVKLVEICQSAKSTAVKFSDDETENLMVERITAHQKALWMLNSTVK